MYKEIKWKLDENSIIESIIERQNGNLWSAIRELYQNSVDAQAEEIKVVIKRDSVIVKDDGIGMDDTRIDEFFRVLGRSSKGEEDLGEFGIGITQILPFGRCVWLTQDNAIVIDREASDKIKVRKREQYVEGCYFICSLYEELDYYDHDEVVSKVKKIVLPRDDIIVDINYKEHQGVVVEMPEYSDEDIEVFEYQHETNMIYLGGIGVCKFDSNYDYSVNVSTARKPKLIFARNEFLESDPMWQKIQERINSVEEDLSLNDKNIDRTKAKELVKKISQNKLSWEKFKDKRIIPGANDKYYSIEQIEKTNKDIAFGEDDIWSDDAQTQGHIVVLGEVKSEVSKICESVGCAGPETQATSISRKGYHKDIAFSDLDKEEKEVLLIIQEINDEIFNNRRRIKAGASDVANAWTDGYNEIHIDRQNFTKYPSRMQNLVQIYRTLVHEYCHDSENIYKNSHGYWFYEKFHKKLKDTLPVALEIIEKNL